MSSDRDTWATSPELYTVIQDIWHLTIDVCASDENHKCARYITEAQDALRDGIAWGRSEGDFYFCNAPGSKIAAFVEKALVEQKRGSGGVMIFQAGISSRWFRDLCACAKIFPLTPRPNFVAPSGIAESGNPRDWMIAVIEPWMLALPSACGIGHPFDWEETGVIRGVLSKPKPRRRAVVANKERSAA